MVPSPYQGPASSQGSGECTTGSCVSNWKIAFSILLVVESLVFGHIVLLVRAFSCVRPSRLVTIMRYGSAVAAGVFLGSAFMHVIPEAVELYNSEGAHAHEEFPVVYSIILFSFYLFLILDQVLVASCRSKAVDTDDNMSFDADRSESLDLEVFGRNSMNIGSTVGRGEDDDADDTEATKGFLTREFLAGFLATLGIGAHSLLESVALGAAPHFNDVLNLFTAIVAHRWATSAALGIRYAKMKLAPGPSVLLVVLFSFICPLGVGVGFVASTAKQRAQSIFFAIGAGTFVYLGCAALFENRSQKGLGAIVIYICSVLGALIVVGITGILISQHIA